MRPRRPTRVAIVSLGCPKNLVDSERILAMLAEDGCTVNAPLDEADVIVVNTCGFLADAREESLAVLREALELKRRGRVRRVVAAGCLATRDGRGLFAQAPGLDAIVGANDRRAVVRAVGGRGRVTAVTRVPTRPARAGGRRLAVPDDAGRFRLTPRHTAYLRIAEGCSRRCTFCAIPAIRGPFRSKTPEAVLAEARELAADGAVELNVIAQDTTRYGIDLPRVPGRSALADLLRRLDAVEGVRWIRLMYAYPGAVGDDLIDAIASSPRVVKCLDLPLQHVSDPVLRRMGRRVSRRTTERLLERLRRSIPGVTIRTTFMVGFPGETNRQFHELLDFARGFRFDAAGVFEFSAEGGTPAADLPGQVPPEVRAERREALMRAQQEIAFAAARRRVDRRIEVLVDGLDPAARCVGRHAGQAPDVDGVCILRRRRPAGAFVRGKVVAADGYDLIVQPD